MTRETVTMVNRRACLRDALNACTAEDIRQEVPKALLRKFPSGPHAESVALDILDATMEQGQPKRETGFEGALVWPAPEEKGVARKVVGLMAACVAAAAIVALMAWAIGAEAKGVVDEVKTYEGVYRKG